MRLRTQSGPPCSAAKRISTANKCLSHSRRIQGYYLGTELIKKHKTGLLKGRDILWASKVLITSADERGTHKDENKMKRNNEKEKVKKQKEEGESEKWEGEGGKRRY